ncbi:hypothetical protein AMAG_05647 [Allomyces macrogynus ATCC 38327]|uniref:HECT-type E3 ubiquitin transferase n=1 Tax=Allomyces macrogynus (strain ATCC 38327) TaxID=578462 RepID=A0A0L0SCW5_ALLM3|nr:hypothetical protein AMAG_05647 [Allomyces macrogynus ATCC 38327]|eukprot:KNE60235.1 hypothetical protein AMAG_05647 [Allomyces macrogynus ATCC 38327]
MKITKTPSRRPVEPPPVLKTLIDQLLSCPEDAIADLVNAISDWSFPRGDLYQWTGVLNRFDTLLADLIKEGDFAHMNPVPLAPERRHLLLAILRWTRLLLENCSNRTLYASHEHLNELLGAQDPEILEHVLWLLLRPAQRLLQQRSLRLQLMVSLERIATLAQPLTARDEPMATFLSPDYVVSDELESVDFSFYRQQPAVPETDATATAATTAESPALTEGYVRVHVPSETVRARDPTLITRLVDEHHVPYPPPTSVAAATALATGALPPPSEGPHPVFALKHKLMFARHVDSVEGRLALTRIRVLAIAIGVVLLPEDAATTRIVTHSLIPDIVDLMAPDHATVHDWPLKTACLHALDGIARIRSKLNEVLMALNASVSHGVLLSTVRRVMHFMTTNEHPVPLDYFDALHGLISFLLTLQTSGNMLLNAGLVALLVQAFDCLPENIKFGPKVVQMMDAIVYGFPSAFTLFNNAQGLTKLVARIETEVAHLATLPADATEVDVDLDRMQWLKILLKCTLHMLQTVSGPAMRNLIDTSLPQSLATLYDSLHQPLIAALGINIMATLIHNEPTCLSILQESKIPQKLIDKVSESIPPIADVILALPNAFGAASLNAAGLEYLTQSGAVGKLVNVFLSEPHVRTLCDGEHAAIIGGGMDELVRHQPTLKPQVVAAILDVLREMVATGKQSAPVTSFAVLDQPIPPKPEPSVLGMTVDALAKFLEGYFQSHAHSKEFLEGGGVALLVQIFSFPGLPYDFPSSPPSYSLSHLFRQLSETNAKEASNAIVPIVKAKLLAWQPAESIDECIRAQPETMDQANRTLFELVELHGLIGLLSDVYSPSSQYAGRQPPAYLQELHASLGLEGLQRLADLHHYCLRQMVHLRTTYPAHLYNDAKRSKPQNLLLDSWGVPSLDEPLPAEVVTKEDGKTEPKPVDDQSPIHHNLKIMRTVLYNLHMCAAPFFHGCAKLAACRRSADDAFRATIRAFLRDLTTVLASYLDIVKDHSLPLLLRQQALGTVALVFLDERTNMNLQTGLVYHAHAAGRDWWAKLQPDMTDLVQTEIFMTILASICAAKNYTENAYSLPLLPVKEMQLAEVLVASGLLVIDLFLPTIDVTTMPRQAVKPFLRLLMHLLKEDGETVTRTTRTTNGGGSLTQNIADMLEGGDVAGFFNLMTGGAAAGGAGAGAIPGGAAVFPFPRIAMLTEMGFSHAVAREALMRCGNNPERAAEYILTHPQLEFQVAQQQQAAAAASPATPTAPAAAEAGSSSTAAAEAGASSSASAETSGAHAALGEGAAQPAEGETAAVAASSSDVTAAAAAPEAEVSGSASAPTGTDPDAMVTDASTDEAAAAPEAEVSGSASAPTGTDPDAMVTDASTDDDGYEDVDDDEDDGDEDDDAMDIVMDAASSSSPAPGAASSSSANAPENEETSALHGKDLIKTIKDKRTELQKGMCELLLKLLAHHETFVNDSRDVLSQLPYEDSVEYLLNHLDQQSALTLALLAIMFAEPQKHEKMLAAMIDATPKLLHVFFQRDDKTWLALLLIFENMLNYADEPEFMEMPRIQGNEIKSTPPVTANRTKVADKWPQAVRTEVLTALVQWLKQDHAPPAEATAEQIDAHKRHVERVTDAVFRMLVRLTRDKTGCHEFVNEAGNVVEQFSRFESALGYQLMVLRHVVEHANSAMLRATMRAEILRAVDKLGLQTNVVDVNMLIKACSHVALRDPDLFKSLVVDMYQPAKHDAAARYLLLKPREAAPASPTPAAPTTVTIVVESLVSQLLALRNEPDSPATHSKRVYLLKVASELALSYTPSKMAFMDTPRRRLSGAGLPQATLTKPHGPTKSTYVTYLVEHLLPWPGVYTSKAMPDTVRKRLFESQCASTVLSGLCVNPDVDATEKDPANPIHTVRRIVIDALLKALTAPDPSSIEARYGKYMALSDAVYRILSVPSRRRQSAPSLLANPAGTEVVPVPLVKILLDRQFVSLLTGLLAKVDTHHPHAKIIVSSILKPIELLTKLSVKLSQLKAASGVTSVTTLATETPARPRGGATNSAAGAAGGAGNDGAGATAAEDALRHSSLGLMEGQDDVSMHEGTDDDASDMDEDEEAGYDDLSSEELSEVSDEDELDETMDNMEIVIQPNHPHQLIAEHAEEEAAAAHRHHHHHHHHDSDSDDVIDEMEVDDEEMARALDAEFHSEASGDDDDDLDADDENESDDDLPPAGDNANIVDDDNNEDYEDVDSDEDDDDDGSGDESDLLDQFGGHAEVELEVEPLNEGNGAGNAFHNLFQRFMDGTGGNDLQVDEEEFVDEEDMDEDEDEDEDGPDEMLEEELELLNQQGQRLMGAIPSPRDWIARDRHGAGGGSGGSGNMVHPLLATTANAPVVIPLASGTLGGGRQRGGAPLMDLGFPPLGLDSNFVQQVLARSLQQHHPELMAQFGGALTGVSNMPAGTRIVVQSGETSMTEFKPMATHERWAAEARLLFGSTGTEKSQRVMAHVTLALLPEALELKRKKEEEDRKKREEQAQAAEAERKRKEEEAAMNDSRRSAKKAEAAVAAGGDAEAAASSSSASADEDAASTAPAGDRYIVEIAGMEMDLTGTGIDPTFLEALPEDLRMEVIQQHMAEMRAMEAASEPVDNLPDEFLQALQPELRVGLEEQMETGAPATGTAGAVAPSEGPDAAAGAAPQAGSSAAAAGAASGAPAGAAAAAGPAAAAGSASGSAADLAQPPAKKDAMNLLDLSHVSTLVGLLFVENPIAKGNLLKLLGTLCENSQSRTDVLTLLMRVLIEGLDQVQLNLASRDSLPLTVVEDRCLEILLNLAKTGGNAVAQFFTTAPSKAAAPPMLQLIELLNRTQYMETAIELLSVVSQGAAGSSAKTPAADSAVSTIQLTPTAVQGLLHVLAGECPIKTFQFLLVAIQNLATSNTSNFDLIAQEVVVYTQRTAAALEEELAKLHATLTSAEPDDSVLKSFSHPASQQALLLRLLKTLDYLASKLKRDVPALSLGSVWAAVSKCLVAIGDRDELVSVVLPLIESFMVVEARVPDPQFAEFIETHRKLLNVLVRNNPSLLAGSFSILVHNPKVLEFDNKRSYFYQQLHAQKSARRAFGNVINLNLRRQNVFEQSYQQMQHLSGEELKNGKLNVRFYGEEGVDAGGLTREWFSVLARQIFNPDYALFKTSAVDKATYQPNRASWVNPEHLHYFKFVGRFIGKAIYDQRLLDCYFTRSFYKHLLGKAVDIRDMEAVDPSYYKSLEWILENEINDIMDLTFSVETDDFGKTKVIDLKPDGRNIAVTDENKHEYVRLVVEQRLTLAIRDQIAAFTEGFFDMVPRDLVSIFNEQELELLISGMPEIDVDDWRNNTEYHHFTASAPVIQWFWRAVRSFDQEHRAKLVQYVTGTSKVPMEGFRALQGSTGVQKFQIVRDPGGTHRLPSAHTCFNQLDLPEYESYEKLRTMLLKAVDEASEGFGFA